MGDLIIGSDQTAIGTLVERRHRLTMLLHLRGGPRLRTDVGSPPVEG